MNTIDKEEGNDQPSTSPLAKVVVEVDKAATVANTIAPAVASTSMKVKKARKTPVKKPSKADKPRRPLSAYNYFFRAQRVEMLQERDEKVKRAKEEGGKGEEGDYGFFGTMAKVIAQRWKEISPDALELYKKKAEVDSLRYREEMDDYNKRKTYIAKSDAEQKKKMKKSKAKVSKKENRVAEPPKTTSKSPNRKPTAGPAPRDVARPSSATKDPQSVASPSVQSQMPNFSQPHAELNYSGLGAAGAGMFPRGSQPLQLDLETQIALLNAQQQQQRYLESAGYFSQASRPALLGYPSQFAPMMSTQQLFLDQGQLNDLAFNQRFDAYQEEAMLRQQMMAGAPATSAAPASQDPSYANILFQLRLQEEERLRNQAAALGMGAGRW